MGEDTTEVRQNEASCNTTAMLASPPPSPAADDDCEELEYGPGIVDKLKSRFISMSLREREPARRGLRRFSSLENLLDRDELSPRKPAGNRARTAFKTHSVKRAVSMETLLVEPDPQRAVAWTPAAKFCRCPSVPDHLHRSVLINEDVVIVESPHRDDASRTPKRREYKRAVIGRDELPRTDIVRTYKRLFEPVDKKPAGVGSVRRHPPVVRASARVNGGSAARTWTPAARVEPCVNGLPAKSSAKEPAGLPNGTADPVEEDLDGGSDEVGLGVCEEPFDDVGRDAVLVEPQERAGDAEFLPVARSPEPVPRLPPQRRPEDRPVANIRPITKEVGPSPSAPRRDPETLPEPVPNGEAVDVPVGTPASPKPEEPDDPEVLKPSTLLGNQKPSWQKPPAATNTVVFDFRGKDVKPNVAVSPTPFGCRAAKRRKKRSRSPPRTDDLDGSPSADVRVNGVAGDSDDDDELDGRDRADDCYARIDTSGVMFEGENVIIGNGALLSSRNKKLHIQFDDSTTSTFEYPSESSLLADWSSSSPDDSAEELAIPGYQDPVGREPSSMATTTGASSGNLSSYTPSMLTSSKAFQLGVSRPIHREPSPVVGETAEIRQKEDDEDVLKPADPADTTSWSSSSTTDLLF